MWLDEAQWDHPLDDNIAYFTYFILFYFFPAPTVHGRMGNTLRTEPELPARPWRMDGSRTC